MPQPDSLVSRLLPILSGPTSSGRLKKAATLGTLEILSEPGFSRFVGRLAQAHFPRPILQAALKAYIAKYNVDVSEARFPLEHYKSFDAFFTRELKEGIHTIADDADIMVSPVDGRILNMGRVAEGSIDQVKGRNYRLDELLDSGADAERFGNGTYVTIYLSPRDYHRIHCPVKGKITGYRYVPGRLYPVNATGVGNVDRLFAVNERLITYVKSALGDVAVVKVGATNVGMITASYHPITTNVGRRTAYDERFRKSLPIGRGAELGQFHLGSTVVLIVANPKLEGVDLALEQFVRMGQPLLRLQ
ncbi:MAG: phosphatidylserine decarboxylase [Myxococcota bacterium]|jgi:phosphatidylserine decarboxylase